MQFYFIRHAQSENNALWAATRSSQGRSSDPALTDIGRRQAELLAQFLARTDAEAVTDEQDFHNRRGFGLTHLYSSLMLRAVATGSAVAQAVGLPLLAWEEVHERGGIFLADEATGEPVGQAGATRSYFMEHYPHLRLPDTLGEAGWWNRPFESRDMAPERARRFLQQLLERHGNTDDRVAVISHGGFYHDFLSVLLNFTTPVPALPEPFHIWFLLNNTGITRIDFSGDGVALVYLNRVDFLPAELIT